ncbi:hypothetical protein KA005_27750, partial [bacterium]|nr:hypothetical protein [bacterium]
LDFETSNLEKGTATNRDNSIVLSVWKDSHSHTSWEDEYGLGELVQSVEDSTFLIAHGSKFELQWLRRCGIDLTKIVIWDTMVAEYCIQGNRKQRLSLDETAKRYGLGQKENLVSNLIKSGTCPSTIHRPWLLKYCIQDVELTLKLYKAQLDWVMENNPKLLNVIYTRCLLTPVLADIEFNGICLDERRVNEEYEKTTRRFQELADELEDYAGGINWNSPVQVAEYLYNELGFTEPKDRRGNPIRTAGGKPSASVSTLALLSPRNKRQRDFLGIYKERNKVKAQLTKNLEFFKGVIDERGGIFNASFNQTVTGTHRLSSSGRKVTFARDGKGRSVQFQNLPRAYKRLFKARRDGWKVGEWDGAQLEFRVAAFLGNDTRAKQDIEQGVDVHQFTADTIGCSRQDAKADTFKPLYGGSSGTTNQQRYYRAFREKYHEITETQRGWVDEVLKTKQLMTITGLVFYWPDTYMSRSGYVKNNESIHNYPVQSFATADIIPISVVYQWHKMKANEMESFMVNTIHDSTITEVHPDEIELYKEIAVQVSTEDVVEYLDTIYDIQFNV